ncbi:Sec-independent protein translocase protein TatB [Asticcacaulis sp. 201]|nr:Sec-independent protein translocase protein TatB [Asticcacaulis sp. 201]MDV6329644.1 Sec-independent protein translocase protein TatB [Asticcacaulis sp. 201]
MVPGIGGGELILIAVVALVVVGPKDLPKLLRQLGRFVGKMRRMADDFRTSFDDMARQSELDDLRKEVDALRSGRISGLDDMTHQMKAIENDINNSIKPDTHYYSGQTDIASPDAADFGTHVEASDPQMAGLPPQGKPVDEAPTKPKRVRKPKAMAEVAPELHVAPKVVAETAVAAPKPKPARKAKAAIAADSTLDTPQNTSLEKKTASRSTGKVGAKASGSKRSGT